MKIIMKASLIIALAACGSHAKPGEAYTLTGQEKSIEAIVKKDMEEYPELYAGIKPKFYIAKFKSENKIGRRKLAPGDQLAFPPTKASIAAEKEKYKHKLIGKWSTQKSKSSTITEYKEDGTILMNYLKVINFEGTWHIKDGFLYVELTKAISNTGIETNALKFEKIDPKRIIKITEDELHTCVKGKEKIIIEKRIQ